MERSRREVGRLLDHPAAHGDRLHLHHPCHHAPEIRHRRTLKIANFARKQLTDPRLRPFALELLKLSGQWNLLTLRILLGARKDRDLVGAAAHDFLMYSGYVTMAYLWLRQATVAADRLDRGGDESEGFYRAKLATAEFYFERLLPRAQSHATSMLSPTRTLMQLAPEHMAFTD